MEPQIDEATRAADGCPPGAEAAAQPAVDLIRLLASGIGPRRPCSAEEERAGRELVAWLTERGVDARIEHFRGYASFGYPYGAMFGTALAGGLLQRRGRRLGDLLSASALLAAALEGDLRVTPVSRLLSRRPSTNVVASVPAADRPLARVCLCAHADSTRSGLVFRPGVVRRLPLLIQIPAVSAVLLAADPLLRRSGAGRKLHNAALAGLSFSLAMLAERELRGEDVPGASDNASGCGVAAQLVAECAAAPLRHTEVDLLITGCEEAGLLGAQSHLRRHAERAKGTLFINFDTVGGDVPLTYVLREGGATTRPASPRLVRLAQEVARRRPELGVVPAKRTAGLPTDVTAALARGCEGITFLAQGKTIPHYHQPSDSFENIAPGTVARALEVGREILAELDRRAAAERSRGP